MKWVEGNLVLIISALACVGSQPLNNTSVKECSDNSDCTLGNLCKSHICVNPCEGVCGDNSLCIVQDLLYICSCKPGFDGDPFLGCEPTGDPVCMNNEQCPADKACFNQRCLDPCQDVCGLNTDCRVVNHWPICACLRMFFFSPGQGCKPLAVPQCQTDYNCPEDQACHHQKCVDPCNGEVCGNNTICSVKNHFPICACKEGYVGDALHECVPLCPAKQTEPTYVIGNDTGSWYDAAYNCTSRGMALATVKDEVEWTNLVNVWNGGGYAGNAFWLGGHNFGHDQQFRWVSTGKSVTYTNWGYLEPSLETCLSVAWNYEWYSRSCFNSYYYVCEVRIVDSSVIINFNC